MSGAETEPAPFLIAISACLLGERVRYDGGHKLDRTLVDVLGPCVRWVPICPEVEAGLGVPRPAMRLERDGAQVRLVSIAERRDLTARMVQCARALVARLADEGVVGVVLKSRSPSCGPGDAPLFELPQSDGGPERSSHQDGVFAGALREALPGLPLAAEAGLATAAGRATFLVAAAAYRASRGHPPPA